jgi:hypothetical protein
MPSHKEMKKKQDLKAQDTPALCCSKEKIPCALSEWDVDLIRAVEGAND